MPPAEQLDGPDTPGGPSEDRGNPVGAEPAATPVGGRIVEVPLQRSSNVAPSSEQNDRANENVGTHDRPRGRAGPLSWFFLVLAVAGVAAAVYFTSQRPEPVAVLIATRDIPAYHTITTDDVVLSTRDVDKGEPYATMPADGRLSLKSILKGAPLRQADVAPDVGVVLGTKVIVHGFAVPPAAVLAGALRPGDRVQLVLVRDARVLARLDAVVLSVTGSDPAPTRTLIVALRANDAKDNEVAISTGTVDVFKDPAAVAAPD